MNKLLSNKKAIIIFIAPAFLLFTVILFVPIIQVIYYSFCDYNALTAPKFIGLKNYRDLFLKDETMGINQILALVGIEGPSWLSESSGFIPLPMWVIAFVALWQYLGQNMMLYIAQISGISKELYEASYIDGASKGKAFRHITLPLIKPMFITSLSLNCIGSLKFFDLVYNMTQGGPNHRTDVLATHLYQQGFQYFKYGYSSAISIVLLVLCLVVTLTIKRLIQIESYEM